MKKIPLLLAILLSFTVDNLAAAQTLYKYKNSDGRTVISTSVPTELAHLGYSILDKNGRVTATVPPAKTREQINQLEALKSKAAEQKRQEQTDRELLRLYGSPQEIYQAMQRKVNELEQRAKRVLNLIALTEKSIDDKQQQIKRAGKKPPEYLYEELKGLQKQKQEFQQRVAGFNKEKYTLKQKYTASAQRLQQLLAKKDRQPLKALTPAELVGKWQTRDDVAIDWNFDASGTFDSFSQPVGSSAFEKDFGTWQLINGRLILRINRKKQRDALGEQFSRRVSQERQIEVLSLTNKQLQVLVNGKTISLHRF